ncbi:MAG TPA: hypothetical protein VJA94_23205 [Candidatus Angelobacter sp.]
MLPERCFIRKICIIAAVFLLSLLETGCLIFPTKMPTRIRGTTEAQIKKSDLDFTFIKLGATRRDEVAARLAAIDTGSPPQFFWGRWAESSWGVVGGVVTGLDPGDAMGGTGRHWHCHNILIKFDNQGIAEEKLAIEDGDTLWHELVAYSRHLPMAPASETIRIPSTDARYNEIVLAAESIKFLGAKPKDDVTVNFSSPALIHLRPHFRKDLAQPELTCFTLEVDHPSAAVKRKANFCASGQQLAQIITYLDHLPAPARWEEK